MFAGVMVLAICQVVISATSKEGVQLLPKLAFDSNPLKLMAGYLGYFFATAPGLITIGATILFYIVGAYFVRKSTVTPPEPDRVENETAALMRGLMVAFSSGMNLILASNIYGALFDETVGLVIGLVLFTLGILASIRAVAQNAFYQGLIGWTCWLAPMSWPVLLLGVALLLFSLFFGLFGLAGIDFLKVGGDKTDPTVDASVQGKIVAANWATGTFFLVGGIAGNANFRKTAFNMGNIGFIHRKADSDHRHHEAGHNLSLFAFGWIFHLIGAGDENVVGRGAGALAELLAESHANRTARERLQMWT
jgi:hypothetical protein